MLYAATLLDGMSTSRVSQYNANRTLGGPHMILLLGGLLEKWTLDLQERGVPFP